MLHRKTNKELKNWTKTDDHEGIQCNILQCVRNKFQFCIKVAGHSFRARFCWCNSARAQGLQKQKCCQWSDHFIYSKPALSALFFSIIERSVLLPLFCYYKDILGKVTTQTTQKFVAFLCYRKKPVKCSACAVARKIETDCFCRNLQISNDPVNRISRNLAEQ